MAGKISMLFLGLVIVFYLAHFSFFPIYETTDSFFYWELAEYFKTGKYLAPHPYYWDLPSTIEPPLYSLFLFIVQIFPRADIIIHFLQISSLFASALLIYKILVNYLSKNMSLVVISFYLLLPANIFLSASLMSEPFAMLFLSVFCSLVFKIINNQDKGKAINLLFLVSSISVLQRYNFIILFALALVLFFFLEKKKLINYLFLGLGTSVLLVWVLYNHQLTGVWGLSNSEGKHLYDRIVAGDGLLPPEENKSLKELKSYVPPGFDLKQPWWEIESYIFRVNHSETITSKLLGKVAMAALVENPEVYLMNTIRSFFIIHGNGLPYARDLYTYGLFMGTTCRMLGTIKMCSPIIKSAVFDLLWNNFLVPWGEYFSYHFTLYVHLLLLFPASLLVLIKRNKYLIFLLITYLLSIFVALAAEVPVYRYLYPLYPIQLIIISYLFTLKLKGIKFRK